MKQITLDKLASNSIILEGIKKTYGIINKTTALNGVTLESKGGECIALVGPNGAGKSTLLKIVAGIIHKFEGKRKIVGKIGYCPENPVNFEFLRADENLKYYTRIKGNFNESMELLNDLNLDSGKKLAYMFSKGMKRKLDIARSLSMGSEIILMDEPFDGLDAKAAFDLITIINNLKKLHKIIIISSHDLYRVEDVASKIFFLKDGLIIDTLQLNENSTLYVEFQGNSEFIEKSLTKFGAKIVEHSENKIYFENSKHIVVQEIIKSIIMEGFPITGFGSEPLENRYRRLFNEQIN